MNFLIVTASNFYSNYGGGQIYVKNLIDELVHQGILPGILAPGSSTAKIESYKGCRIYTFDETIYRQNYRALYSLLKEIKPDLVHAHGFKALFAKACKSLNIPCVITAHHGGILCPAGALLNYHDVICHIKANPKDCLPCVLKNIRGGIIAWPILKIIPLSLRLRLGRLMQRLPFLLYFTPVLQASLSIQKKADEWKTIYTSASLLIAPSKAIADSMQLNGAPAIKIKVIPHGIPLPDRALLAKDKRENKQNQPLKFFYVGRICHVKGVHVMLAAFNQLSTDAELHIIGGVGNKVENRYLQRLKKNYFKNTRIIWHGKVEPSKVNQLISQYDIMVHPAICLEVFGLNIAEALALGKPVIATRCGGAEMQIQDGVNGWLIKPNNSVVLRDIMIRINNYPELLSKLTDNLPFTVKSIENHVHKLIDLYETVID